MVAAVVEQGGADVATLALSFGVSSATIRRDLETLEHQRLVTRTHGGAMPHEAFNDLPLTYKTAQNLPQKLAIARQALEYIRDARVVGMTGGTTVTEFARLLPGSGHSITVVTNALNIAIELVENASLRVFAAGGEVRSSSQETVGPSAEAFLTGYNIDVAMIGVDGVDSRAGCTNYDPVGARVNGALIERAQRVIVLVDSTKIGRVALAPVCSMSQINVLITDSGIQPDLAEELRASGCELVIVDPAKLAA